MVGIGLQPHRGPGAQTLKGLVNLTSLNLWDNGIGDEGAQALKGLTKLTSLGPASRRDSHASTRLI